MPPRHRVAARGRALRLLAASLATVLAVAACTPRADGEATPATPATAGLVILSGVPGEATLTIHDERGDPRSATPPDPNTAWISAGRRGNLIATLADGTLRLSNRVAVDAEPEWSIVPDEDAELPEDPLYFGTWSPNGISVATLAAAFGAESRLTLTIIDPVGSDTLLLPIPRRPIVAPPVWLDDERVALQTAIGLAVVNTSAGGAITAGPEAGSGEGVALDASADRSTVVVGRADGSGMDLRDLAGWLARDGSAPLASVEDDGEVGAVALDRRGTRLAVVWQRSDGPGTLVVYRRSDGWREAARLTLPDDSARAAIDWLP